MRQRWDAVRLMDARVHRTGSGNNCPGFQFFPDRRRSDTVHIGALIGRPSLRSTVSIGNFIRNIRISHVSQGSTFAIPNLRVGKGVKMAKVRHVTPPLSPHYSISLKIAPKIINLSFKIQNFAPAAPCPAIRRLRRVAERADRGWILTVNGS